MKKTLLALAVPALLAASAANAATVYEKDGQKFAVWGRVQATAYNDAGAAFDGDGTSSSATLAGFGRLRLEGSTALNDQWKAIAKAEWQVAAENSDGNKFKARHVYLGADGGAAGKIIAGQTDTAYYDAIGATDMFNQWGSGANGYTGRQPGQIIYSNTWGGFHGGVSYQFADDTSGYEVGDSSDTNYVEVGSLDYGYAANFGYNFEQGFGFTAGLAKAKYDDVQTISNVDKDDWAVSGSYGVAGEAGFYGAAMYNQTKLDSGSSTVKYQGYELIGIYRLENNVSFLGGYNFREVTDSDFASIAEDDTVNEILVGAGYDFTSNFLGWVEYAADQIDGNDDRFAATLQYNF